MKSFIETLPDRLFARRGLVLTLVLLVTLAFAAKIPALRIYTDFEGLLPQQHPFIKVHNEIRGLFGGANVLTVAVEVKDGTIFTNDNLAAIDRVTNAIDNLPGVNHNLVSSITHRTARFISLTEEGSVRSEVYYNPALGAMTPEQLAAMKAKVLVDPRVFGLIVSPDLKAALIKAQFIDGGQLDYLGIFQGLQDIRAHENKGGIRIHTTGQPALIGWVYSYLPQSLQVFAYTAVIVLVLLVAYFRRFHGVALPLVGIFISTVWGLGYIVVLGYHLDPLMLVIPFLIAARSMSHGIQIVERWYQELARVGDGRKAAEQTLREMFHPGTLGITCDAIGLALLVTGSVRVNFELGVFTALWALSGMLNVLVTVPLLLSYMPTPKATVRKHSVLGAALGRLGHLVAGRRSAMAMSALGGLLVLGSLVVAKGITIGESEPGSPLLYRDHDYNLSSAAVNALFPGSEQLLLVAKADKPGGLKDPEAMKAIEAFNNHMLLDPELGGIKSVPTLVRQVNKLIHNGDQRWEQIPHDAQLVGGVLFAYMASSPIPGTLNDFITSDYSKANLALFYKDHKGETVDRAIAMAAEGAKAVAALAKGVTIELAGGVLGVTAAVNREIFSDNLKVIPMVFVLICSVVGFTYRSWHAGLLMFIAMLVPTAMTYAYLSVNRIGLNINTVPLISVGLGIGIDYAVYIIDRIRDELHEHLDFQAAIGRAIATTGLAVTCTVTTLVGGIVAWVFVSDLRFQADAAKLLIFMIVVCAVSAMVFVPAWIAAFRPKFITREADQAA
ncbi:MMPL family transporter [Magnetospirillum sp. 15-1]|uniref:efflux RND transporter permease subunit n=1 Tax=Magnetospirillum sp. 15-1 TaxID=1979370 RepID=UPI000BBB8441|nr:MMPL family transporter [Magnetospirillum sp. 15-1]